MGKHFMRKILELECVKAMAYTRIWEEQIEILKGLISQLCEYGDEQEYGDLIEDEDKENIRLLHRLCENI